MSFLVSTLRRSGTIALLVLIARGTGAQDVRIGAVGSYSTHDLLRAMSGFTVGLTGATIGRIAPRVSYTRQSGVHQRRGNLCVGLIPPGVDCSEEIIEDRSHFTEFALSFDVARWQPSDVGAFTPFSTCFVGAQVVQLQADSRGTRTGKTLTAERTRLGAHAGCTMALVPHGFAWLRPYGAIDVSFNTGETEVRIDGDVPFNGSILTGRLTLGLQFSAAGR